MRDPARIDAMMDDLLRAWRANPHLRLGQLVDNAARLSGDWGEHRDSFFTEDGPMAEGLRALARGVPQYRGGPQ